MLFWFMIAAVVVVYIWSVRRIAWLCINDIHSGNWERIKGDDYAFGITIGILLGWTAPFLMIYFWVLKPLYKKFGGTDGNLMYRLIFSRPRS